MKHPFSITIYIAFLLLFSGQIEAANASKIVIKEAQRLEKSGWRCFSGDPSLAEQLDKSYMAVYEYDEELFPKFYVAEASWEDITLQKAEDKALELAKLNLYSQFIATDTTMNIEWIEEDVSQDVASDVVWKKKYICMGEVVGEVIYNPIDTIETTNIVITNMDAAQRTYFQLPCIKAAKTLIKAYRITNEKKYEVLVRIFVPSRKSFAKIGNLYYFLDDSESFLGFEDPEISEKKTNTAIVTYHWDYANLESITIPPKVVYANKTYNVIGVCDNAFYEGKNIVEVKYPAWINMSKAKVPEKAQMIVYNP